MNVFRTAKMRSSISSGVTPLLLFAQETHISLYNGISKSLLADIGSWLGTQSRTKHIRKQSAHLNNPADHIFLVNETPRRSLASKVLLNISLFFSKNHISFLLFSNFAAEALCTRASYTIHGLVSVGMQKERRRKRTFLPWWSLHCKYSTLKTGAKYNRQNGQRRKPVITKKTRIP